jgi:hypothetical protein
MVSMRHDQGGCASNRPGPPEEVIRMSDYPGRGESAPPPGVGGAEPALRRPHRRGRRRRAGSRGLALAVIPVAVLGSGALVYQASNAAFTATTSSTAQFSSGTVSLTNSANVAFNVSGIKPGDSGNRCIDVTYGGSLTAAVKLYLTNYSSTGPASPNNLADFLRLTLQEGAGTCASNPAYSYIAGTNATTGASLVTLKTNSSNYGNGIGSWGAATNGDVHSFIITWWLPDYGGTGPAFGSAGAPADQATFDAVQGSTASASFTWEARNT